MNTEEFEKNRKGMSDEELIRLVREEIHQLTKPFGRKPNLNIPPRITDTDLILREIIDRYENLMDKVKVLESFKPISVMASDLIQPIHCAVCGQLFRQCICVKPFI